MHKILQNATNKPLPVKYFEVFTLRLLGLNFRQIAEKTGYSHEHIRYLFSKAGVLSQLWVEFLVEAKKSSLDEAIMMMYANLPDIARNLVNIAKGSDMSGVRAAQIVFSYTLGDPRVRAESVYKSEPRTVAEWIKQQTLLEEEKNIDPNSNYNAQT